MKFKTFAPPQMLLPFIKYFWALQTSSSDPASKTFSAIVDGCPGVIMLQSERAGFSDEAKKKLPNIFLYGQTVKPVKFSAAGNIDALGICFQPHALKSVFGMDAHELTDACLDLNSFAGKNHNNLSEQLLNSTSLDEQIKTLSFYLIDRIQKNGKEDEVIMQAVNHISQNHGDLNIKELQTSLKMTERTLERRFKQTIGISPKLFSRICHFQHSLGQYRKRDYGKLSDIAYENDYADQSHFIRVFREFTGFSPLDFRKQTNEVVENFPQING